MFRIKKKVIFNFTKKVMDFKIWKIWIYFTEKKNRRGEIFWIFKINIVEENFVTRKNVWSSSPPLFFLEVSPPKLQREGGLISYQLYLIPLRSPKCNPSADCVELCYETYISLITMVWLPNETKSHMYTIFLMRLLCWN